MLIDKGDKSRSCSDIKRNNYFIYKFLSYTLFYLHISNVYIILSLLCKSKNKVVAAIILNLGLLRNINKQ